MKSKTGKIIGFVVGSTGFLLLFKLFFLDNTRPADELAPGIVVIASILNGYLFAFVGRSVRHYLEKTRIKITILEENS